MNRVFFKFFIISLVPSVLLFIAITILIHSQKQETQSKIIFKSLIDQSFLVEKIIEPYLLNMDFSQIDSNSKNELRRLNSFIVVLSDSLEVVFSTDDLQKKEYFKIKEKLLEIIRLAEVNESFEFSELISDNSIYFRTLIKDEKKIGSILCINTIGIFRELNQQFIFNIILAIVSAVLLSMVNSFFFTKRVNKSVKRIVEAYRDLTNGNFDVQIESSKNDDFFSLASTFNEMSDHLRRMFSKISTQKDDLNSVISSIQEGLLVIDSNDIIVLSNESMKRILESENIIGYEYGKFIKNSRLWQLINRTRDKRKSNSCELQIGQDFYLCTADFMENKNKVILIFFNITESKKLEIVKKDFITNVSHELRTPLTSIKGFIETLMDEIDDNHRHYLEIINNNTRRLISIVEDLLTLSELENKETPLILTEVNLPELIKNISIIFEQKINEKNIQLELNIEDNIPVIQVDAFRIEQLMINLIDNAIKYSQQSKVEVILANDSDHIFIKIKDDGLGIPNEHISRIFERFYTVDKSHSRKSGGTGLGLSIVKHIVQSHHGEISVESEIGKGTIFSVKLPISYTKANEEDNHGFQ